MWVSLKRVAYIPKGSTHLLDKFQTHHTLTIGLKSRKLSAFIISKGNSQRANNNENVKSNYVLPDQALCLVQKACAAEGRAV